MMQPQTGIAALPAPAPGQAQGIQQALPQMKPSSGAQGATPPSNAPVLSMMDLSQLNRLFQQQTANPSAITSPSMITVLAEISKKQKAAAQQKQLEGAQAMQAAAQQPRTVRDEILAQVPMQAPPRMATGGPVAFAGGDPVIQPGTAESELLAELRRQIAEGEAQKTLPPELVASRKGLADLRAKQLAGEQAATTAFGEESKAARDAAMARANVPLMQDARGLLGLAASIDPRRGRVMGSLATGAEKYLGGVEAAKTAATEKYATAQEKMRGMETINRQLAVLNDEKNQALLERDYERANQKQQAINVLKTQLPTLQLSREDLARKEATEANKFAEELKDKEKDRQARLAAAKIAAAGSGVVKNDPRKVFDTLVDNAARDFKEWETSVEGAKNASKPEVKEAKRIEFLRRQVGLAKAAGVEGLDPLLAVMEGKAPAAAVDQTDPLGIRKK